MTTTKNSLISIFLFLSNISIAYSYYIQPDHHPTTLNNLAFGSCYGGYFTTNNTMNIFQTILKRNPQLWIWLGDVAYIDEVSIKIFNKTNEINNQMDITHAQEQFDLSKNNACML